MADDLFPYFGGPLKTPLKIVIMPARTKLAYLGMKVLCAAGLYVQGPVLFSNAATAAHRLKISHQQTPFTKYDLLEINQRARDRS